MANSAFHNRNSCHQENANNRQICTHQSRQATNRHNHRIEILKIPSPQGRRLQGQGQPHPSAQHQRRPVSPCRRMLINAGRLGHKPITPHIPVNQVSSTGETTGRNKEMKAETRPPPKREPGFGSRSLSDQREADYAFTFFWILITRFVRAVICFFRAFTISET